MFMPHFITSNPYKYSIMNPKHSFHVYPSVIQAFGLAILCTYNFKYLSTKYIHLVAIGPHISNTSIKWYNKCVMMSKKEGGK
jgi:hypothetical protein